MKTAIMVFSDKEKTEFMRRCDVFGPGKVVVMPTIEPNVIDEFGQDNVDFILKECLKSTVKLIAVFTKGFAWKDATVKEISDGTNWTTADNYFAMAARKTT